MVLSPWHILILGVVLTVVGIPIADATPPPYVGRAWYLLPQPASLYYNESNGFVFSDATLQVFREKSTRLPWLSEYCAFGNYTHKGSGTTYVAEIWYYHDWESFQADRDYPVSYLPEHGAVTPVSLDLSEELANSNNPYISGLRTRQVNATRYISGATSGYFIIFSTGFFPGENYYIAYYGTGRGSALSEDTPCLKALIMSVFPGFVEHTEYMFDPVAPKAPNASQPGTQIPGFGYAALVCAGTVGILLKTARKIP